ncbi:MAG: TetR/AcrR family transcriptional regulator [Cyanobacteriota bacterium]|nr:TetR/AcrR family transcriptional regulator [Cyanobacteriota bacterium]
MSRKRKFANDSVFRHPPQQQRSQERVEQILQAAAEVFWEMGYDAATTHDVAKRAGAAVGTLYRFFPNKLAIFHALEQKHRQSVERINAQLLTPEFLQPSLEEGIRRMVATYAEYFEDLMPRVVYVQYFLTPDIFVYFNERFNDGLIRRFAQLFRWRNPKLSMEKSELIARVVHQSYCALLLVALRSDESLRDRLYQEIQDLLIAYLKPHAGDGDPADSSEGNAIARRVADLSGRHHLNPRQQAALTHVLQRGSLTIGSFEDLCRERSRRTLQRDLKQLVAKGLFQVEGETNLLIYRLKPGDSL